MNEKTSVDIQDRMESRIQQRRERRAARTGRNWLFGAILVMVGLLLLASNMNFVSIHNWWAFFILIPAVAGFGAFVSDLQSSGTLTSRGWSGLIAGLTLSAITAIFIFNLDLRIYGPIALILGGMAFLVKSFVVRT